MSVDEQLLDQLALVSRQIEQHKMAQWLLEQRRTELHMQLKAAGFAMPAPSSGSPGASAT